jgi:hypothetical protein
MAAIQLSYHNRFPAGHDDLITYGVEGRECGLVCECHDLTFICSSQQLNDKFTLHVTSIHIHTYIDKVSHLNN